MQTVHDPAKVALQDASSSAEQSVAEMPFATTRSKAPPEIIEEPNNPPVKEPPPHLSSKIKSSVQDHGPHYPPPTLAERNPLLEQTTSPTPKEIPVKAVPMKDTQVKTVPMRAILAKAPPETPDATPK